MPSLDQCRSVYDPVTNIDMSLKFTGPGFVLERHFTRIGVKEWTLFLKSEDMEDTPEEEGLEGVEDEQLQRRKEEETHALVLAMKREWEVWLDVLPFPPALHQFEPGVYTMTSSSLNPHVLKGMDFGQLRREVDSNQLLDFVSAPKVLLMSLVTSSCTISGDQAHLEHWVSGAERAPNYSEEEARPRQAVQKVPKPLLGQIFPCNFVEFNPNVGPSTILANLFELPFMSCFKHASVESNVCLFKRPRHRENLFCSRGVFLYLCFFDGLFLELTPSDPLRRTTEDACYWRWRRRRASPRTGGATLRGTVSTCFSWPRATSFSPDVSPCLVSRLEGRGGRRTTEACAQSPTRRSTKMAEERVDEGDANIVTQCTLKNKPTCTITSSKHCLVFTILMVRITPWIGEGPGLKTQGMKGEVDSSVNFPIDTSL